jgi:hypothetical protein
MLSGTWQKHRSMPKPLQEIREPFPVDERLVASIAGETELPASRIRRWLAGEYGALSGDALSRARAAGENLAAARKSLWSVLEGVGRPSPIRTRESFTARIVARAKGAA